jgi:16S rRNA (cytosine967-C5)-methyltransferase
VNGFHNLEILMKKPNIARSLAFEIIHRVETENAYADILVSQTLKHNHLQHSDSALLNELVRGVIRWKKKLDWIVDQLWHGRRQDLQIQLRISIWLGLYQLSFLERIPAFAAVSDSVQLTRNISGDKSATVVNAILRRYLRETEKIPYPDPAKEPNKYLAVMYSHPRWIIDEWVKLYGLEETATLCLANNQPAPLSFRVNELVATVDQILEELSGKGVSCSRSVVSGFLRAEAMPFSLQYEFLEKGKITIQDESAGLASLLFRAASGEIVVDCCASPGGKCSHVAERSREQAIILAADIHQSRTRLLRSTVQRLGLRSVHVLQADSRHFPARTADIVLLDAPCSGWGVLRRKPDLRWRRKPADAAELAHLQTELMSGAANLVKPGGKLIYSTCTILPAENENRVSEFLNKHAEFSLQSALCPEIPPSFVNEAGFVQTWPHRHDMDGSFAALLIKH